MTTPSNFHDHLQQFLLYSNVPGAVGIALTWIWGLNPVTLAWCIWLGIQIAAFSLKWIRQERARRAWMAKNPGKTWPGDFK